MRGIYTIKTLSPVHIGTGDSLSPWDYGITNDYLYVFSLDKLIESINDRVLQELLREMESGRSAYKNLGKFLESNNISRWDDMAKYKVHLKDNRVYKVWEEIKTGEQIYIPGSSLKGAIRTAIMYCALKDRGYKFALQGNKLILKIENSKELSDKLDKLDKIIQGEIFGTNPTQDILKYLRVSDSKGMEIEKAIEVYKVYVANTSSFEKRNGAIKMHPEHYECIKPDLAFDCINISIESLRKDKLEDKYVHIHIYEKYIKNWKKCLYEFSKDLLDAEIKFWEECDDPVRAYKRSPHSYIVHKFRKDKVIRQLSEIKNINSEASPVVRLGKLTGYFTHSIGLLIAKYIGRDLYNLGKIGKLLGWRNVHEDLSPLTRRLTLDNETLGWVQLIEK